MLEKGVDSAGTSRLLLAITEEPYPHPQMRDKLEKKRKRERHECYTSPTRGVD